MELSKLLKVLNWILIGGALILLWLSLRSEEGQMEYSIAALGVWGLAWFVCYLMKRQNEKTEKDQ